MSMSEEQDDRPDEAGTGLVPFTHRSDRVAPRQRGKIDDTTSNATLVFGFIFGFIGLQMESGSFAMWAMYALSGLFILVSTTHTLRDMLSRGGGEHGRRLMVPGVILQDWERLRGDTHVDADREFSILEAAAAAYGHAVDDQQRHECRLQLERLFGAKLDQIRSERTTRAELEAPVGRAVAEGEIGDKLRRIEDL
ncbi:hypothetical protein JNJ66_05115 [Candidatus Saccharibacteria bacterium]|nr:hypothetical protein [Candidatus Saccharibacteria bacterium]